MKNYYRKALLEDLDEAMKAVEDSRETLRLQGNGQWQDGYPNRDDFLNDIKNGRLFLIYDEENPKMVVGVCALTYREEDYHHLYEGEWLSDFPYMVMHRVALKKEYRNKGYGKKLFDVFVEQAKIEGYRSLRIDTHEGNAIMRHLIESYGFSYCGKAILTPNKDRLVYERVLKEEELPHLVLPCSKYLASYKEAIEEDDRYDPESEQIFHRGDDVLEHAEKFRLGIDLPEGYVPETKLWLVDDKTFIGEIHVRHQLTKALLLCGGNIGYGIRYSKRGHGYGKKMLELALNFCKRELDLRKVLITCNDDNYASEKVMLSQGAIYAGESFIEIDEKKQGVKQYWINLNPHILETERFYLREFTPADRLDLSEIYQDKKNMKRCGGAYDEKKMDLLMKWTLDNYRQYGFGFWAIIDKSSGEFVGDCGLTLQSINKEILPEIGYHIKRAYHNSHYASEAARAVKEYIFKNYDYDALYGYTFKNNVASMRVMKNNGMSYVKTFGRFGRKFVVYRVERPKNDECRCLSISLLL